MGRGGFSLPSVYFTKWVAIQNSRLWGLYICVYIILVALVAASIALFQVYFVPVEPHLRLQLWNDVTGLTGTACPTDNFDYDPGNGTGNWQFMRPRCATSCALGPPEVGTGACVTERQIIRQDNDVLFFATAFNEKVDLRYHNNMTWMAEHFDTWLAEEQANTNATVPGSPCPFPVNTETVSTARQCRHHASYLMPQQWFEALHAKFTLEYQVEAPDGALADVAGMTTVVKNADGGTYKEFAAGQVLSLSVKEALEAAGLALSDVIDAQVKKLGGADPEEIQDTLASTEDDSDDVLVDLHHQVLKKTQGVVRAHLHFIAGLQALSTALREREHIRFRAQESVIEMFTVKCLCTIYAMQMAQFASQLLHLLIIAIFSSLADESKKDLALFVERCVYAVLVLSLVPPLQFFMAKRDKFGIYTRLHCAISLFTKGLPMILAWAMKDVVESFLKLTDWLFWDDLLVTAVPPGLHPGKFEGRG
ncbi:unnamed protein product [Symbiodinium sp. CCMP2592]|nr:unnamed protein product [Symbiodinium sp. CCMP2592]